MMIFQLSEGQVHRIMKNDFHYGNRVVIDNIGGHAQFDYSSTKLTATVKRHGKIISAIEPNLYMVRLDSDEKNESIDLVYYGNELKYETKS